MRLLYPALGGFVVGVSAFFTFVVPEAAFASLGGQGVGAFLTAIFPRFYEVVSAGAAALTVVGLLSFGPRHPSTLAPGFGLALTLAAWLWWLSRVNEAVGTPAFGLMHGLSLGLDAVSILLWLAGIAAASGSLRVPRRD